MAVIARLLKRRSTGDLAFSAVNLVLLTAFCILILYPVWYIVVLSFNEGADAMLGGIYFWPRKFTLQNYRAVFQENAIVQSFLVTIARTVLGTATSVFFTAMVSFAYSKARLIGRNFYLTMGTVTLIFNGGLIPTFLLIRDLHLYDSFWVYIIPSLFGFYNCIIFMSFFRTLPPALEESAMIDGANEFQQFIKIILPLSKPILATIALFTAVGHWNDYFTGVIYIQNPDLIPIQTYLYRIVAEAGSVKIQTNVQGLQERANSTQALKLATMVVTTLPIVCVYPFLQKYFVKGVMIGAVKG